MEEQITHLTVEESDAGERLDRYVARAVEDLSRSYAQQLIESGQIMVNDLPARASLILRAEDQIVIRIPPAQPVDLIPESIPLDIVYEDENVVVINKPAGMVVHPAPGHSTGTLVHALIGRYPDMQVSGDLRPGIVHRLDAGTSGLLVIARNDLAMRDLGEQQRQRQMEKHYYALVEGPFREEEGVIDAPIGRHPQDRLRMAVVKNGRSARTHYRVLEALGTYTLLDIRLETGRTHQIRVHLLQVQRPVVGDPLYGARKRKPVFGLERQFLHAYQLGFRLPGGEWREFTSPLPSDLQQVLDKVRAKAV